MQIAGQGMQQHGRESGSLDLQMVVDAVVVSWRDYQWWTWTIRWVFEDLI